MTAATGEDYDEFALIVENAEELGLAADSVPIRARVETEVGPEQHLSAIQWGEGRPSLVLLHGGAQNAHTWDSVLLALGRPALAIDLPGHGHSSWRPNRDYSTITSAEAVAAMLRERADTQAVVVGMSMGGLTTLELASRFPELVKAFLLVDVTPGTAGRVLQMTTQEKGSVALAMGPATFDTLEEMVDAAVQASPRRAPQAVARGVRHNARPTEDGRWRWRYDSMRPAAGDTDGGAEGRAHSATTWDVFAGIDVPLALVRGGESKFVPEEDVAELLRLRPGTEVHVVAGAGHSVQSDQPLALVEIIENFYRTHAGS